MRMSLCCYYYNCKKSKRTEVVNVKNYPHDWKVLKIEDVADVKGGKRLPKGYTLQEEPNGYPYITVSDMYVGGISTKNLKYVPEEAAEKIKNYRISKDDLFISVAGTLGIVGKVPDELHNANLTENADKLTNIKIDKEYLYQVLISDIIQKEIEKVKTANAQPKLALTRIKNFQIPVPTNNKEIRKIASILSTWDKVIQLKIKLIELIKMQKIGLMQRLLTGKERLPGFKGEWTNGKLGEFIKLQGGFAFKSSKFKEKGIPIIRISNIVPKIDDEQDFVYYDDLNLSDSFNVKFGDILIAMSGATAGKVGIYKRKETAYLNQRVGKFVILDKSKLDDQFLYYLLNSSMFKMQLKEQLATGAQPNISSKQIEDFKFKIPPIDEQKKISKILNQTERLIVLIEKELDLLVNQKKGITQLLLSGKVRIQL